jgi:hypothetical protein
MAFNSILFPGDIPPLELEEPDFFVDLNLDQLVASMLAGREQYELKPFFYTPLHDVAAVRHRHEALRELEKPDVLESITRFGAAMRRTRTSPKSTSSGTRSRSRHGCWTPSRFTARPFGRSRKLSLSTM